METLEKAIANLPDSPAPRALKGRILAAVMAAAERAVRIRRALFGTLALCSAGAIVPALIFLYSQFHASPFISYLSLIFTDGGAVLASWKEFSLTLVESAPIAGLTFALAALLALLASLKALVPYLPHGRFAGHAAS